MKGEIYNFVFYSDIGTGTVASKSYFVDWGRLPNSRYKVTFSFTSSTLTVATTFDGMLFIPELGCTNNTIVNSPSGINAYYNGFIGLLRNYSTNYIENGILDNPPSFLQSKPTNNQIIVHIHQNTSTIETAYTPLPARYTLILSLEQLDDYENKR
jgi:hypothetical protein